MAETKKKTIKQLETENDHALIRFWRANVARIMARDEFNNSPQARLLQIAELEWREAEEEMTNARMAFLLARSGEPPKKGEISYAK